MTCIARRKWPLLLRAAEKPEGIFAKAPGNGIGKGKAGDVEAMELRGRCMVDSKNLEKSERVRSTATAKNEHHLLKERESTAL